MTQDEIIRMAREAGFTDHEAFEGFECSSEELEHFAALVAAHERKRVRTALKRAYAKVRKWAVEKERELCAKVCDENAKRYQIAGMMVADECAAAIRARGNNK